jgi:NAD(P) transhydrogenase subunit alpha
MPTGASSFYSRNIYNLLLNFVKLGELRLDFEDEVTAATVITHGGKVVQEATKKLLQPAVARRRQGMNVGTLLDS